MIADANGDARVLVEGRGGWFDGLRAVLEPGGVVVVGRSRSCHVSLRKSAAYREADDKAALVRSKEFNRISRIHCELTLVAPGKVEVRDLSSNGTWVQGSRVKGSVVADLGGGDVEVAPVEGALGRIVLRSGSTPAA
jgi:pSer/pThr/pTyr-binding forkhead associated (FHA) protein